MAKVIKKKAAAPKTLKTSKTAKTQTVKTPKTAISTKVPKAPKTDKKVEKPAKKTALGLPDGSDYRQKGQRRPLIVFPK